jgi:hypothetical protein
MNEQPDLFGDSSAPSFHNTTAIRGTELAKASAKARSQEDAVLKFFKARAGKYMTPEDAAAAVSAKAPLTSVRRCISDLTKQGLLRKTSQMKKGRYGARIHYWIFETTETMK